MKKKKGSVGAIQEDAEMDMSPMIDMVFLLLIFFVVNATAITVKKDKNVVMPTASASNEVKSAKGYIVLNLWAEKRPEHISPDITMGTEDSEPLASDEDVRHYIQEKIKLFKANEIPEGDFRLYIRGDQKAIFKHARKAIAIAGAEGVPNIVFGVLTPKKK